MVVNNIGSNPQTPPRRSEDIERTSPPVLSRNRPRTVIDPQNPQFILRPANNSPDNNDTALEALRAYSPSRNQNNNSRGM